MNIRVPFQWSNANFAWETNPFPNQSRNPFTWDDCALITQVIEGLMRKSHAKMLPYDSALGVLDLGKLRVLHGYHTGTAACRSHANVYGLL